MPGTSSDLEDASVVYRPAVSQISYHTGHFPCNGRSISKHIDVVLKGDIMTSTLPNPTLSSCVCVCVWGGGVRERERCCWLCEREREREREAALCVCVWLLVCVSVCVRARAFALLVSLCTRYLTLRPRTPACKRARVCVLVFM